MDVVTVYGYHGQSPAICFSYRRHQVLNIAGEKTHVDMIQCAVNSLKELEGINIVEWSACVDYSTSPRGMCYSWKLIWKLNPIPNGT